MKYRTTCPHCASVFRLGADQLDAAQGWVQCGVCGAAFDARPSLLLEDGSPLPPPAPLAAAPLPETAPPVEHEAHEAAPGIAAAADEATPTPDALTEDITAADTPRGIIQRDASLDLPSIILIDPDIAVPDEPGPLPQIYPAPSTYPPEPAAPAHSPAPTAATVAAQPRARIEYASPLPGKTRVRFAPRRIPAWAWGMASALLLVLLLAQTAYFLRDTLVSRLPQTRPALEQACTVLGCTLSLPKNLAHLQIIGSDLQTEASGRLRLTLTLGNRAGHAQAWPVLVLTLTDQRNRPLARRSFAPSEYLGDARRIADGLPPRSEQALSLPLTVRDLAPMGFDLQLTY
ncbi:MAG: zinc-ribbon domain-containing protein [Gammaproteobacteria bacterium]|nr:zinc-ribbon domain-containing protein [Gammaproteobacteria bacterium]MBU1409342.1 zinc-ribbon domain-containing protein [Gammaproteobacteria bacterium]MBU1531238.1 zinc-ribbon domain-containing protein [Gammaproteobacteria bacterium]